jgi:hypothetical protein
MPTISVGSGVLSTRVVPRPLENPRQQQHVVGLIVHDQNAQVAEPWIECLHRKAFPPGFGKLIINGKTYEQWRFSSAGPHRRPKFPAIAPTRL